jgi:hypothetical protein
MNHKAIYTLYPQAVSISDVVGATDKDGNKVEIDLSLVDAWIDPEAYKLLRQYPPITDQLDAIWKGGDAQADMLQQVMAVKAKYPKG